MAELLLKLEGQLLTKQNEGIISSGDLNVDLCKFEFNSDWNNYIKTAVFYQDKEHVAYAILDSTDRCLIPSSVMLKKGRLYIGVFGVNDGRVLTSSVVSIDLLEGAVSGTEIDIEPTDDIFIAIVSQYQFISNEMVKHNKIAEELKSGYKTLSDKIDGFGAVDTEAINAAIAALQISQTALTTNVKALIDKEFVLQNKTLAFINKACQVDDARITNASLVDVYFTSETYKEAEFCRISVESYNGYILLTSDNQPATALKASIIGRVV